MRDNSGKGTTVLSNEIWIQCPRTLVERRGAELKNGEALGNPFRSETCGTEKWRDEHGTCGGGSWPMKFTSVQGSKVGG